MRKTAVSLSLVVVLLAAGAFAFVAHGGDSARAADVAAANARTAQESSVHYAVTVRLTKKQQPYVLHVDGGASKTAVAVWLKLDDLKLPTGQTLPGQTGALMLREPFLYERAPSGMGVPGNVRWLRLSTTGMTSRSQVLSTVHALTPAPLLRVVAETKLHSTGPAGAFAGVAPPDDPVVLTALSALGGGLQYRHLRVSVLVGRDGLIHRVGLAGRTADGSTRIALRARLYAFGVPVKVVPPKPGTFLDRNLAQLQS